LFFKDVRRNETGTFAITVKASWRPICDGFRNIPATILGSLQQDSFTLSPAAQKAMQGSDADQYGDSH
jgi:hypothetical protein